MLTLRPFSQLKRSNHQAVILPFKQDLHQKHVQSCIFCGKTLKIHTFKGKAVCHQCLQLIPTLFSCGNF